MSKNLYHNRTAQWLTYVAVFAALAFLPAMVENAFTLNLFGRFIVLGMLALSVSLVWGTGGILSLGQGIAFGLAAYGMGMTMQMQSQDAESNPIPSFMLTNELTELPALWEPFWSTPMGLTLALLVPTLFFALFGLLMFQARVAGVFVAIMTLAMLSAWYSMAFDLQPFTGGFNGISPPAPLQIFGHSIDPYGPLAYWIVLAFLAALTFAVKLLLQTKFGLIVQAIRDDPERARFLGYSVSFYQVVVFSLSGLIAAIAGVLWVMMVQFVSPTLLEVAFSVSMVIWAAVGGRLSPLGAIFGAFFVNGVQSFLGDELLYLFLLVLGGLFILIVRFLPNGLSGLLEMLLGKLAEARTPPRPAAKKDGVDLASARSAS
jgi:urea transport system permease protein